MAAIASADGSRPVRGSVLVDISTTDYTPKIDNQVVATRWLMIDNASAATIVKVTFADGSTDVLDLAKGVWHQLAVQLVWKAGTTATGIHLGF